MITFVSRDNCILIALLPDYIFDTPVFEVSFLHIQKVNIISSLQIVAFLVAMAGIIMITYMDKGFASHEMWGAMLALVATAGAAAYKVK